MRFDSAVVFVRVGDYDDSATFVSSWAIMLSDVTLTPVVYRWVATQGQTYFFGHARVAESEDGKGDLLFEHNLLGDFIDPEELKWALFAVGRTANQLDEELQGKFGGRKFVEG